MDGAIGYVKRQASPSFARPAGHFEARLVQVANSPLFTDSATSEADKRSMKFQRITGLTVAATLAVSSLALPATSMAAGHEGHHSQRHAVWHTHKAHHNRRAHRNRRTHHSRRTHHVHHTHHAVMAHIALVGGAR
jgi:hypothetical protein